MEAADCSLRLLACSPLFLFDLQDQTLFFFFFFQLISFLPGFLMLCVQNLSNHFFQI